MSLFQLVLSFEKRGHLDLKITGHAIDRPANVRRGEAPDCVTVTHQSHSVFKPNADQEMSRGQTWQVSSGTNVWQHLSIWQWCGDSWVFVCGAFGFLLKPLLLDFFWSWVSLCNPTPRNEALCSWKGRWSCQAFVVCKGQHRLGAEDVLPSRLSEDTPCNLSNVFSGDALLPMKAEQSFGTLLQRW